MKSSNIERSESEEEPAIHKALIERLRNLTSGYVELKSVMRVLYFVALRLPFIYMLDSIIEIMIIMIVSMLKVVGVPNSSRLINANHFDTTI